MRNLSAAHALGVRQAGAPVVAFAEDHAFADPAGLRRYWLALAAARLGGDGTRQCETRITHSAVSWADFLIGYGRWMEPIPAGAIGDHLPGHNSSYKRAVLLDYGDRLEELLESAAVLHADLRAQGHRLYLEPAAKVSHLNSTRFFSGLRVRFFLGRVLGAARATAVAVASALALCRGSPLIPWLRLRRILHESHRPGLAATMLRALPALVAGLIVDAAGEAVGYASGIGSTKDREWDFEFHRERYLWARDPLVSIIINKLTTPGFLGAATEARWARPTAASK